MILVVDIGNSNVVYGLSDGKQWLNIWRINTVKEESLLYYQLNFREYLFEADIDLMSIKKVVISSVVPDLTEKFADFLQLNEELSLLILNNQIYDQLKVSTSNPYEMGTDLMANAIAAMELAEGNKLIVDFGTALTFTLLDQRGEIQGVNIVPGIKTAIKALASNTAQLHAVPVEITTKWIGKTTVEAIQSGVMIGYEGLIKHMIKHIKHETEGPVYTIATGGLCNLFKHIEFDHIEQNLTLDGLLWVAREIVN